MTDQDVDFKCALYRFTHHEHSLAGVTGVWLQPSVATIVSSATGAIVAEYLDPSRARLTVVVCYVLWGVGFLPAILIMSSYFLRLAVHKVRSLWSKFAPPMLIMCESFLVVSAKRSCGVYLPPAWTLRTRWFCAVEVEHGGQKAVFAVRRNGTVFDGRSADVWKCGLCWNNTVS